MNKKNNSIKFILSIVIVFLIIVILSLLRNYLHNKAIEYINQDTSFAKNVDDNNKLKMIFEKEFPDRRIILACESDITGDNINDLVVISSINDKIETIALVDKGNNIYEYSEPIPAPRENQMIKFFNMDKDNITEVLITGEKKGQVGYAIYRYENGIMYDIFGEGMEDCC